MSDKKIGLLAGASTVAILGEFIHSNNMGIILGILIAAVMICDSIDNFKKTH